MLEKFSLAGVNAVYSRFDCARFAVEKPLFPKNPMSEFLEVIGAKTHNLKNVRVKIPKHKLVTVTGVS